MRKCKTCEAPLWASWIVMSFPRIWRKRGKKFKDATCCTELLPVKVLDQVRKEVREEMKCKNN